jgi:hypothetical protein
MPEYDDYRCYVDHLIAEHRRLHRMVRLARAAIVGKYGPDQDATSADIVRVLRQMKDELTHHFTEEEEGGCLDEAVSRCPSLSTDARRLEAEHPQILEHVDRLIAQALDSGQSVEKQVMLQREFDELCQQLHAHEAAENILLRKAFGANINGDETDRPTLIFDT